MRPFVAAVAALALLGCSGPAADPPGKPIVIVSVPPLAYVVERLAGDLVTLEVMIPPGVNPHTYEPSMSQLTAASRAALCVKVGQDAFPFENAWLNGVVGRNRDVRIVDASEGLSRAEDDPHVWVSPRVMASLAQNTASALSDILPGERERIDENLDAFLKDIEALDSFIRESLRDVTRRKFLVFHPAWGTYAKEYGLEQIAIEHGHKEPSPKELARIIRRARDEGIGTVFVQPQFPSASATLLARDHGLKVAEADALARDWLENLRRVTLAFRKEME